jgi:hypothetical protein
MKQKKKQKKRNVRNKINRILAVAGYLAITNIYVLTILQALTAYDCTEQTLGAPTLDVAPEYECDVKTNKNCEIMFHLGYVCLFVYGILPLHTLARTVFGWKTFNCFHWRRPAYLLRHKCSNFIPGKGPCYNCSNCDQRQRYAWVFEKYRTRVYYWEVIIILRKGLVGLFGLFLSSNPLVSLPVQMLMCALFFLLSGRKQPYLTDKEILRRILNKQSTTLSRVRSENQRTNKRCAERNCEVECILQYTVCPKQWQFKNCVSIYLISSLLIITISIYAMSNKIFFLN